MKKLFSVGLLVALLGLAWGTTAKADTIGTLTLPDCGGGGTGCPSATYSFDIGATSATLTISVTGAVGSTNNFITGVDLGFSPSGTVSGLSLPTSPSTGWTATTGSLSSGGTCGVNSGAFVCASASPLSSLTIATGGVYTWTWDYTLAPGTSIDAVGDVHIGAEYGPNQGNFQGLIVSQTGATSVPEPGTLSMLAAGLLSLAGIARRRQTS